MAGKFSGSVFYAYSNIIEPICKRYYDSDELFTFDDLNFINPEYTKTLHRKFVACEFYVKSEIKRVKTPRGNVSTISYYKLSNELKSWYIKNYISLIGKGVIAKSNRASKGIDYKTACALQNESISKSPSKTIILSDTYYSYPIWL